MSNAKENRLKYDEIAQEFELLKPHCDGRDRALLDEALDICRVSMLPSQLAPKAALAAGDSGATLPLGEAGVGTAKDYARWQREREAGISPAMSREIDQAQGTINFSMAMDAARKRGEGGR